MGCCGEREKLADIRAEQKWDYIILDDFRSNSCFTPLSYGVLFISLLISISVYAVDTFTAINLLVFDRWSGQIKPTIPFEVSRWIFAGCILLSFILLFYRWMRAIRVIKQGGVAQSYLDPLGVRLQSIRMGKNGRGYKRFLVFADLTKSKKGADYVALFTYFSFEAWLRICFAEGPRQVVNALTLYSVMQLNLVPAGEHAAKDGHTPIVQFFVNIQALADKNQEQAVILFGMLFTLVVWVITVINLIIAIILYVVFLWHHVPSRDGGLKGYCRRKINERTEKIIKVRIDKALKKENAVRARQEKMDGKEVGRQPTLPSLGDSSTEKLPEMPILSRTTTQGTLPAYMVGRPDTPGSVNNSMPDLKREPTLPDFDFQSRPGGPSRTVTQGSVRSTDSFGSNAPLLNSAGEMGYGDPGRTPSPFRAQSPSPSNAAYGRPLPNRSMTGTSQSTQRSFTPGFRPPTAQGRESPGSYAMGPIPRSGTAMSGPPGSMGRRTPGSCPPQGPGRGGLPMGDSYTGRSTPVGAPPRVNTPGGNGYAAFNPSMRPGAATTLQGPYNNTDSSPIDYFGSQNRPGQPVRSGTAPAVAHAPGVGGYEDIYDSYSDGTPGAHMPPRAATTTPSGSSFRRY